MALMLFLVPVGEFDTAEWPEGIDWRHDLDYMLVAQEVPEGTALEPDPPGEHSHAVGIVVSKQAMLALLHHLPYPRL